MCGWCDMHTHTHGVIRYSRVQYHGVDLGAAQFLSAPDGLLQSQQGVADRCKLYREAGTDILAALHFFR